MSVRTLSPALAGLTIAVTALVGAVATPASAAPAGGPGQICTTAELPPFMPGGEATPLTGPGGYFAKVGGCASSVAHGAYVVGSPFVSSSLTTRAGYVQTCQVIREVEGFPFDFGYGVLPDETVGSIGECATTLREIHVLFEEMQRGA